MIVSITLWGAVYVWEIWASMDGPLLASGQEAEYDDAVFEARRAWKMVESQ